MTVFFFNYEVGTAVWPREFYHGNLLLKQSSRIPVAIPRFLLRTLQKTPSFDSPWFGLSYRAFAIVYSSLVTLLWLIHRDFRNLWELTRRSFYKMDLPNSSRNRKAIKSERHSRTNTKLNNKSLPTLFSRLEKKREKKVEEKFLNGVRKLESESKSSRN